MAFIDEIAEQGRVLRDLIEFYGGEGHRLLDHAERMAARGPRSIVFAGMGTSEFVPGVIRDYLGEKSDAPVVMWEAGELLHYGMNSIREDDLVVAVSQSGESIETRKVVEGLQGHPGIIAVTNSPDNTMARLATLSLPMIAGEEATISNKTYTNSMAVMLLLGRALAGEDWPPVLPGLEQAADEIDRFYRGRQSEVRAAADLLGDARTVYFVSRGAAMVGARQAALTFQEGTHVATTALPGGSMRHGPFEVVGPGNHAVLYASDGHGGDLVRSMALEIAGLGSRVVLMTSRAVPAHENVASIVLRPGEPELFPLPCAMPQELLIVEMAADRGRTAGIFAHGSKITVKE